MVPASEAPNNLIEKERRSGLALGPFFRHAGTNINKGGNKMHSFEFTGETKVNFHGVTVHRIRATRDIPRAGVKKGDEGGWSW